MLTLNDVRAAVKAKYPDVNIRVMAWGAVLFECTKDERTRNMYSEITDDKYPNDNMNNGLLVWWLDEDGNMVFRDDYIDELIRTLLHHM